MLLGGRNELTKNDEYLNHNSDLPQVLSSFMQYTNF
jgi:hypothetical protein